jgi:hypothetical protein
MTMNFLKAMVGIANAVCFVAVLSPRADAATIFTPALDGGAPTGDFICLVINVTSKPVDVTNELRNAETGASLISIPCTLPPGGGATTCAIGGSPSSGRAYCVVTVKGSAKKVRVTLRANDTGTTVSAP